jgi:small-conductance mechanosensitive channel
MTANFINIFDFKTIFLQFFLGNQILFIGALFIILSAMCGYYQMSNRIYAIIMIISFILFAVFIGEAIILSIVCLVSIFVFKILGSIASR